MLWRRKQADGKRGAVQKDQFEPAALTAPLSTQVFTSKLECLLAELEERGGLPPYVEALRKKHELFAQSLDAEAVQQLDRETFAILLDTVFTARRRLNEVVAALEPTALQTAVRELVHGTDPLLERMGRFVDIAPAAQGTDKASQKAANKLRRAAWDLAAELVHFRAPEQYPLMARWVWDVSTESGAMREFIAGGDTYRGVPYDNRPETFEAMRHWMAEQLSAHGFYRDVHFLIDMVLAWSYGDYMRAMSNRMGMIESEFGGKHDPTEPMQKLLGIDASRSGRSGSEQDTVH